MPINKRGEYFTPKTAEEYREWVDGMCDWADRMTGKTRMRDAISLERLLLIAAGLKSEQGENHEYDRALVEVCCESAGWPMDDKERMAEILGVRLEV